MVSWPWGIPDPVVAPQQRPGRHRAARKARVSGGRGWDTLRRWSGVSTHRNAPQRTATGIGGRMLSYPVRAKTRKTGAVQGWPAHAWPGTRSWTADNRNITTKTQRHKDIPLNPRKVLCVFVSLCLCGVIALSFHRHGADGRARGPYSRSGSGLPYGQGVS